MAVEFSTPEVGAYTKCFLCTREEPWGTFDPATGATVCVDCRDAARLMPSLVAHRLMYGYVAFFRKRWTLNCSCGWHDVQSSREASNCAAFNHMTEALNALNDFGATHYRRDHKAGESTKGVSS